MEYIQYFVSVFGFMSQEEDEEIQRQTHESALISEENKRVISRQKDRHYNQLVIETFALLHFMDPRVVDEFESLFNENDIGRNDDCLPSVKEFD